MGTGKGLGTVKESLPPGPLSKKRDGVEFLITIWHHALSKSCDLGYTHEG